MLDTKSLNEKLMSAVCKGKTGSVEKLLEQGAKVNCRDKRDGMTPLLKACQRRNYTMQKLLLSKGANAKHKDKLGLSCLHYIAEAGDTESLKMLIAYQASIEAQDVVESSPLHYASDRNKLKAVDTLVFCGANAFQKNQKGISPLKSTNDSSIKQLLKESELVLLGIKNGDIHIESRELEPSKIYQLDKTDLTIYTTENFPLKSLSMICRRVRPEFSHPSLKPHGKELLISDTFEFLTSETPTKALVTMDVPLYDFPDPFEDIFMKTDVNPTVNDKLRQRDIKRVRDEKNPGQLKWHCTVEIDITHTRSFNLIAFPIKETFNVGRLQAELSSIVDKFIKISIQENTFSQINGTVSLEVIPSPVYTPEGLESVQSIGHFYDLTHSHQETPQKTVNLRVPLPQDYEDDNTDLYLLGSDVDSDYFLDPDFGEKEDMEHWEIIGVNPKISKLGCVNIPVNHFSIYVASEAKKNKSKSSVISETSALCRRASKRTCFIVFLVLVKPVGDNVFTVVIECTTKRKRDDRVNYWINKNYLDQKPSYTEGEFESTPGSKYILKLSDNVKTVVGFPKTRLEFHPKRENCQQFHVTMADPSALNLASIDIYELKDNPEGKEVEEGLVAVAFRLTGTPFIDDLMDEDDDFKGFTKDSLLRQICNGMDQEWVKVAVLLGLSFRTVELYRTNTKINDQSKKFQVMQLWRNTSKHREDYGVDDLVSALHRTNREDLVQIIHKELETWLEKNQGSLDRFYKWAEHKLNKTSLQPSDTEHLVPASEQFFVVMVDKYGNDGSMNEVGLHMGLSRPENDRIFNDALTTNREHQQLGMLVAARDKIGDMFQTYVQLEKTLAKLNMDEAFNWTRQTAEEWIKNTEKDKNPAIWRQEMVHYLKKGESMEDLLEGESTAGEKEGAEKSEVNQQSREDETIKDDVKEDLKTNKYEKDDRTVEHDGESDQPYSKENQYTSSKRRDSQDSQISFIGLSKRRDSQESLQGSKGSKKRTDSQESLHGSKGSKNRTDSQESLHGSKGSKEQRDSQESIHSSKGSKKRTDSQDSLQSSKGSKNRRDSQESVKSAKGSKQNLKSKTSKDSLDNTSFLGGSTENVKQKSDKPETEQEMAKEQKTTDKSLDHNGERRKSSVVEEEYAEDLSHVIMDDALDSVNSYSKGQSKDRDTEDIKELRENLETLLSSESNKPISGPTDQDNSTSISPRKEKLEKSSSETDYRNSPDNLSY